MSRYRILFVQNPLLLCTTGMQGYAGQYKRIFDELQKKHYEHPYNVMPHVGPKQHDVCDSGENQQVAFASGLGVCDAIPVLVVLEH